MKLVSNTNQYLITEHETYKSTEKEEKKQFATKRQEDVIKIINKIILFRNFIAGRLSRVFKIQEK